MELEERDLKFNGTHLLDLLQSQSVSQSADVILGAGNLLKSSHFRGSLLICAPVGAVDCYPSSFF